MSSVSFVVSRRSDAQPPSALAGDREQVAVALNAAVGEHLQTGDDRREKRPPVHGTVGQLNSQPPADVGGDRTNERARLIQRQRRRICIKLPAVIALVE